MSTGKLAAARYCPFCGIERIERDNYVQEMTGRPPGHRVEFVCFACGKGFAIHPSSRVHLANRLQRETRSLRVPNDSTDDQEARNLKRMAKAEHRRVCGRLIRDAKQVAGQWMKEWIKNNDPSQAQAVKQEPALQCEAQTEPSENAHRPEANTRLTCLDCPAPYGEDGWCDVVIPNPFWNAIAPEVGVLCFRCMTKRLIARGFEKVPVIVTSGPYSDGNEEWRLIGLEHGYQIGLEISVGQLAQRLDSAPARPPDDENANEKAGFVR